MVNIQLKVNPDELSSKASEITDLVNKIERAYQSLNKLVGASYIYWEGEAADKYRGYAAKIDKDAQVVLKRLKEHPGDLLKMAGVYSAAEENIVEQVSTLPVDVIS